jgi:pilus assembly protein CpaC
MKLNHTAHFLARAPGRALLPALLAGLLIAPAWAQSESPPLPAATGKSAPAAAEKAADKSAPTVVDKSKSTAAVPTPSAATPPAAPPAFNDSLRHHVAVEVSKGRIIRIDAPVKTVFIANPNIADVQIKSPTLIYLTGKKPGETTLIAVDDQDRILFNAGVTVNHNLSRMKRTIDAVLPGNKINVRSVDGAVVLVGEAESPLEVGQAMEIAQRFVERREELVNSITVRGPNMVQLRVRVVEMQRQVSRQLGIKWGAVIDSGAFTVGLFTGAGAIPAASGILARFKDGNFNISALVDLLEQDGYIKTLAQPTLSALSGKSAAFLAGGEFPIPVPQGDGAITVEFKRFGVSLSFTPVILAGNHISLRVAPEVSQLSTTSVQVGSFAVPSLVTRRAETMVEVGSGQSIVIAGLLQDNVIRDLNKVPWLSDVPVIGKLFTSEQFRRNETELVIIVTPYIVGPLKEPVAVTPGVPVAAVPAGKIAGRTPAPAATNNAARFQLD